MFRLLGFQRELFGIWLLVSFDRQAVFKGFEIHLKAVRLPPDSPAQSLHRFAGKECRLKGFGCRCLRIALKGDQPVRDAVPEGKTAPGNKRTHPEAGAFHRFGFVVTGGFHSKNSAAFDPGSKQQNQVV